MDDAVLTHGPTDGPTDEPTPSGRGEDDSARARAARRRRRWLWAVLVVAVLWIGGGALTLRGAAAPDPEYAFLHLRSDGSPVAYPCEPIGYVVDPVGAPDDWQRTLADAVAEVEQASGYDLVDRTAARRPESLGPVVFIRWATESEEPELAGRVLGTGGSAVDTVGDGEGGLVEQYRQGEVLLDTVGEGAYAAADRRVTLVHELGHVLGLDHVASSHELMSTNQRRSTDRLGPGDRIGLARLHQVSCGPVAPNDG